MPFRRNDALFPKVSAETAKQVEDGRPVTTVPGTAMDAAVRIANLPSHAQIEDIARVVQNTLDVALVKFETQLAEQLGLRARKVTPIAASGPAPVKPPARPRRPKPRQGNS